MTNIYEVLSHTPYMYTYEKEGTSGVLTIGEQSVYTIDNNAPNSDPLILEMYNQSYDTAPKQDAAFDSVYIHTTCSYKYSGTEEKRKSIVSAGLAVISVYPGEDIPKFNDALMHGDQGAAFGNGTFYENHTLRSDWDGIIMTRDESSSHPVDKKMFPSS